MPGSPRCILTSCCTRRNLEFSATIFNLFAVNLGGCPGGGVGTIALLSIRCAMFHVSKKRYVKHSGVGVCKISVQLLVNLNAKTKIYVVYRSVFKGAGW